MFNSDLASAFGKEISMFLRKPFVAVLLEEANMSGDDNVQETCAWAATEVRKALQ